jgi:formylmethanofuran dehydrogenase subunit E
MRAAGVEPLVPYPGAHQPWRCRCLTCGNEGSPILNSIRRGNGGCRYCGAQRAAATRRVDPAIAVAEMREVGVEPLEPYPGAREPWLCRCLMCGNEVTPRLADVRRGQGACRYCAGNAPVDADTARQEFAVAGVEMIGEFVNTATPTLCRCLTCGNEVTPRLGSVRQGKGACRYCGSRRSAEAKQIDSAVAVAEMREVGVEPLEPYPGAREPWLCRCLMCGNEGSPRLTTVRKGIGACRYCAGNAPVDADTARQEFAVAGVEMIGDFVNTATPTLCRCLTCGNEVTPRLGNVRSGRGACWFCGGSAPVDADTARQEFAEAGVEMIGDFAGVLAPTLGRCLTCGNEVTPRLDSVRRGRGACLFCAGQAPVGPETARQEFAEAGVEMIGEYVNTHTPTLCRCLTCGNEVSPRLHTVRGGQGPCRYCAPSGFQPGQPAAVYLFRHDDLHALKIGITNQTTDRLTKHERFGWTLVDLWFHDVGEDARLVEQAVLASWKNYDPPVGAEDMPQAGYTETVSLDDISEADAVVFIESLVAAEE